MMKNTKSIVWPLVLMIIVAALYRAIPGRPWGFAPQYALALFGGAVIRDKRWAFALPLVSMFLSDVLYQVLFYYNLTPIQGFYSDQLVNYALFAGLTLIAFTLKRITVLRIVGYSILLPTVYYLAVDFLYWLTGGRDVVTQLPLTRDFRGLMQAYIQGWPFYRGYVLGTLFFSAVLFGGYYLLTRRSMQRAHSSSN